MATDPNLLLSGYSNPYGAQPNYLQQQFVTSPSAAAPAQAPADPAATDPNAIVVNGNYTPAQIAPPANAMQMATPPMPQQIPPQDPMQVQPVTDTSNAGGVPAPRKRMSLAEVIGKVGDTMAALGGKTPLYQEAMEHKQDRPIALQAAQLNNQAKQADIAQTGVATQTAQNAVLGNYARVVQQTLKDHPEADAHQVIASVGQTLGIPAHVSALFGQQYDANPQSIDALALAGAKTSDGEKFNGNYVFDQAGSAFQVPTDGGPPRALIGPDGKPLTQGNLHFADQGPTIQAYNPHNASAVGAPIVVGGKPGAETQATGIDPKTGLVTYTAPAPGTKAAADIASTQAGTAQKVATTEKTTQAIAGIRQKQADTQATALSHVTDARDSLAQVYSDMNKLATDPNLASAVGPVAGRLSLPQGEQVRAQIEALAGEGMAAASAKMKAAMGGGATNIRTQREFDALTASLIGAVKNTHQTPTQYAQSIRDKMAPIKTMVAGLNAKAASMSSAGKPPAGWGTAKVVGK